MVKAVDDLAVLGLKPTCGSIITSESNVYHKIKNT